jgi:protease YdgD
MPGRTIVCLVTGLWLLAAPALAQGVMPGVQPEGRVRVDVREAPWRSIGKLQAVAGSLRETCTAALVTPRVVLTAAHCLFNIRMRRWFLPTSLHFLMAMEGWRFTDAVLAEGMTIGSGYDPDNVAATRGADWALVTLAAPIGEPDRLLPLAPAAPPPGTEVMVGGYAQDNPNVLTADVDCRITDYLADGQGRRLLHHDCAATHGVSGAPLLALFRGRWSIVGVNVARAKVGIAGLAVTLDEVRGRL